MQDEDYAYEWRRGARVPGVVAASHAVGAADHRLRRWDERRRDIAVIVIRRRVNRRVGRRGSAVGVNFLALEDGSLLADAEHRVAHDAEAANRDHDVTAGRREREALIDAEALIDRLTARPRLHDFARARLENAALALLAARLFARRLAALALHLAAEARVVVEATDALRHLRVAVAHAANAGEARHHRAQGHLIGRHLGSLLCPGTWRRVRALDSTSFLMLQERRVNDSSRQLRQYEGVTFPTRLALLNDI